MLEEFARIPVEVEYASEFRYRNPIIDEGTLVMVISQSGETIEHEPGPVGLAGCRRVVSV